MKDLIFCMFSFPEPLIEGIVLSPGHGLGAFVGNQLAINACIHFGI